MKRLNSSDSLGALVSLCPNSTVDVDEHNQGDNHPIYTRDLHHTMFVEGLDEEESCHVSEKKRRLSVDQVKALEKNFEVEIKLEPERKVKLAGELGLQPRQVAVWFQNRRARWKTKQLERDYGHLKASHDALKQKYESLQRENESLQNEIQELKSKLNDEGKIDTGKTTFSSVEEEQQVVSEGEENCKLETPLSDEAEIENCNGSNNEVLIFGHHFRDGSSDSDLSAIQNEDNNYNNSPHHQFLDIHSGTSSSSINIISFHSSDYKGVGSGSAHNRDSNSYSQCQTQFVKIEELNFFGEECCSALFSDDQAPTLQWGCSDEWS